MGLRHGRACAGSPYAWASTGKEARRGRRRAGLIAGFSTLIPQSAAAAGFAAFSPEALQQQEDFIGVSVFLGLVLLSTITALLHLTGRNRWIRREHALSAEVTELRARLDRAQLFLSTEPQILVAWGAPSGEPDIEGDLTLVMDAPIPRRVLGFGSWLAPAAAQEMERCVERLRSRGEAFRMALASLGGRHLEAEGRAVGGRAVLRIRDVSGDRLELMRLRERHGQVLAADDALRTMLDAIPDPVWLRDANDRLTWVNAAYARAVDAKDSRDAVLRAIELLDRQARDAAEAARRNNQIWRSRVGAVVSGERHVLSVVDVPAQVGSVGIGNDLSELEAARGDLERQIESHRATLDRLPTAVAIFDRYKRLVFHNSAYRQIWSLEQGFLSQKPTDGEILDTLRVQHRLPEQADFRSWKAGLMAAYQAVEPIEQVWHLPDRRAVRTVISPNPQGGVTYLFDDVTERFNLKSEYNALYRTQTETLDALKEGVAVFGSDGRLKLFNPAFTDLWHLDGADLKTDPAPHVEEVARRCADLYPNMEAWSEVRSVVSGLHEERAGLERRFHRRDGAVIDFAAAPLPDGATLLTFANVTDSANIERALTDRNQALIEAERLRDDFVKHVSYELRTPLTNIIGFIEFLTDSAVGPLNARQLEYVGYIKKSSTALLAIINNILDLATIDAGAMELTLSDVDIAKTIGEAAEGLGDRFEESALKLNTVIMDGIGSFIADRTRVLQILFNLLSNAIGFSDPGQTITLAALRRNGEVVFKVIDQGRGIPPEIIDKVFDRFESNTSGSSHTGAGLGLSIVRSFVELHGGKVLINSAPGEGTTVTCVFPAPQAHSREQIEETLRRHGLQFDA
ncbi:MAG: PAS-domain containing protein [Methylobacteriaceae bacterium]|nr:PAS-domain containing protein [Methylobacteriaceae bacterium]MBV9245932.1 PAS-domain containing protein [Methylobacteriaceae bacterium]